MHIVCLLGSPRAQGNSAHMAQAFLDEAHALGATSTTHALNRLTYRGCQGCGLCKTKQDHCVLRDDLTQVLEDVRTCDALVLSTPIYYFDIPSQLKAFIDRTYSFLDKTYVRDPQGAVRLAPGKRSAMLIAQGHPDETQFADVPRRYASVLRWYGFGEPVLVRACGVFFQDDWESRRPEVLDMARAGAREMLDKDVAPPLSPYRK